MSTLLADTHVHIYPDYDPGFLLHSARANLQALQKAHGSADMCLGLFLTERFDCHVFNDWAEHPGHVPPGWSHQGPLENAALQLQAEDGTNLFLFAGRQVVTKERIEVLALTVRKDIEDGQPVQATLEAIHHAGGIPVLSWAPGKWFFSRGQVIRSLVDDAAPSSLLLGDTTLRPTCWPTPKLMQRGTEKGIHVLAGSDPLPFTGEETWGGQYASDIPGPFDPAAPVSSVRKGLLQNQACIRSVGKRHGLLKVLSRLKKNADSKKTS